MTREPHAMIRGKRGRYVKECRNCPCPDGCACNPPAEPCGCGVVKPRRGARGVESRAPR